MAGGVGDRGALEPVGDGRTCGPLPRALHSPQAGAAACNGQAAGYLMTFILAAATFVFDQGAFLDLALALGVVNLLTALILESWL